MLTFIRRLGQVVIDFCYTSSVYSMSRELRRQQAELEIVLMVLILDDDLGCLFFPPITAGDCGPICCHAWLRGSKTCYARRGRGVGELTE